MKKYGLFILIFLIYFPFSLIYAGEEFGNRIPTAYVVVKGTGQSDKGIPTHPNETFSYDLALRDAGIENFNVVYYTSVLSPESYEISYEKAKKYFNHGSVLETIMAKTYGKKGQTIVAGIGRVWAEDANGKYICGFAAEYERIYNKKKIDSTTILDDAKKQLTISLQHELQIRNLKQKGEIKFDISFLPITKKHGIVLVALGFVSFIYPDPIPSSH